MRNPNTTLAIASGHNITDPPLQGGNGRVSEWQSSGGAGCGGFLRDVPLIVTSVLLVLYLGFRARRHVKKLSHRQSYVMIAYYVLLWVSALLNLAWSLLQGWQCAPGKATAWNLLSLFTECGMLSLEISIVAFLLQENYSSGLEGLAHTFVVSGSFVAVDILVQAIIVFGLGIPLFVNADSSWWGKWSVLFIHALVLTSIYCYILFVHYSKWRDKLPPRPSFYNYVVVMFIVNIIGLLASGMAGIHFGFGLWLYNFVIICRHCLYIPFLYMTFLADFLQEEDWLLDNIYYSEMKDAGFFDTDWE